MEKEEIEEMDHLKTIKKINETENSQSKSIEKQTVNNSVSRIIEKKDNHVNGITEKENAQFEEVLKSNGISKTQSDITIEDEICFENIKPMKIFKELEEPDNVRMVNKSLQRQKLSDENQIFR